MKAPRPSRGRGFREVTQYRLDRCASNSREVKAGGRLEHEDVVRIDEDSSQLIVGRLLADESASRFARV